MNFQNIPRSDKTVKAAFIPKLDAMLYFDYKSIEPRLLAFYLAQIGDMSMAQVFLDGRDLYTEVASRLLNIADSPLTDEERQIGKVVILSMNYGGGAPTLMRQLNIPFAEAKGLQAKFHRDWPGIRVLQVSLEQKLQERGYLLNLYGRHLRPDSTHKVINTVVQSSAADLMKAALVKVHRAMTDTSFESHMVSVIHDEIVIDAREEEIDSLARIVPALMRDERVNEIVPVVVDIEISRTNWAMKEGYAPGRTLEAVTRTDP